MRVTDVNGVLEDRIIGRVIGEGMIQEMLKGGIVDAQLQDASRKSLTTLQCNVQLQDG